MLLAKPILLDRVARERGVIGFAKKKGGGCFGLC
jgi:hypothetical protein